MVATDTAVLDLRERSVARGQGQSETGLAALQISRAAKHLVLDLPIGSKEGPYEVGLLTDTGDQLLRATGIAELNDHITGLRVCGSMLTSVAFGPETIFLRFESLVSNGLDIPSGCFDPPFGALLKGQSHRSTRGCIDINSTSHPHTVTACLLPKQCR